MARTNVAKKPVRTHEGARAKQVNPELQLRRSVLACLLWERGFYESGETIAHRVEELVPQVDPDRVASLAVEARERMKIRHAPLLLVREMARHGTSKGWREAKHKYQVADTLARIIQRADELAEFVSIYWRNGKQPLSAQVKKGLARAFPKFDAYQLAKWDRKGAEVRLRDVLFLCHAKPRDKYQEETWRKLAEGQLEPPDTWEVALSSGSGDKKYEWERLLADGKLGAMAVLRNLRNFDRAGVDESLVKGALDGMRADRVLPFRFIAAARFAPHLEPQLEAAMMRGLGSKEGLGGTTVVLVDVSGSMSHPISAKSDMTRMDAACGLAMVLRELGEDVRVYSFSLGLEPIPNRRGFALRDAIVSSQDHMGTLLGTAIRAIYADKGSEVRTSVRTGFGPFGGGGGTRDFSFTGQGLDPDRLVVFTDEQSHDPVPDPMGTGKGYMINVASARNGVGYGAWHHVDGWSEAILDYIKEFEREFGLGSGLEDDVHGSGGV